MRLVFGEVQLAVLAVAWRNRRHPDAQRFDPNHTPKHPADVYGWEVLEARYGFTAEIRNGADTVKFQRSGREGEYETAQAATSRAFRTLERRGYLTRRTGPILAGDLTAAGVQACSVRFTA